MELEAAPAADVERLDQDPGVCADADSSISGPGLDVPCDLVANMPDEPADVPDEPSGALRDPNRRMIAQ